ncbi:MAG: DUF59 domain-containing protein [Chloroflexi bacterium]|nr:DUF59 domain-containing protein [Chloroflexota bacterium]
MSEMLISAVVEKLREVIDPETGVDVVRMRLIEDLTCSEAGDVSYTFRPSSPLCPIAVPLAMEIIQAVSDVPGVKRQHMQVVDYVQADQLNALLKTILES